MDLWTLFRHLWLRPSEGGRGVPEERRADGARDFAVLLTGFHGDDAGAAEAVADALGAVHGVTVRRLGHGADPVAEDEDVPVSLARMTARVRKVVESEGALVAVVGAAVVGAAGEHGLRLRFVSADMDGDPASGALFPGDHVDLPLPLGETAPLAVACTLAALPLGTDAARRRRVDLLRDIMTAVDGLLSASASSAQVSPLAEPARPAAALCYAAMVAAAGFRSGQQPLLDRARDVTRMALSNGVDAHVLAPAQVAAARGRLGDLLLDSGARNRDPAALEEAAKHLHAAGKVYTIDLFPTEHAHLMAQRGRALHRLSALSNKSVHMKEAVQAYRLASQVWTRAAHPQRWAEMCTGMGALLGQIGEFTGQVEILDRACRVLGGAAEIWTRTEAPRRWAGLQNNIGACRFAQGKRTGELPHLREAAECFALALEVYQGENMTRNIHVTQKNLARVERLIAVQEGRG